MPRRLAILAAPLLLVAACGSSSSPAATKGSGPVDVLYAGSLVNAMNEGIGPAFGKASGFTFTGFSGDSGSLANSIRAMTRVGDVFISASAAKDALLEGAANGNWAGWYATFARSPLLIAYNPHSRFASALKSKPWYEVITETGFLIGRTDPATDPKGKLIVEAIHDAETADHAPGLHAVIASSSNVFPEETLVGRLQSGNLDAGFLYSVEATSAHLPTVALTGVPTLEARYTITILTGAPHPAGALSFLQFILGPAGSDALKKAGLELTSPVSVSGSPPPDVQAVLSKH